MKRLIAVHQDKLIVGGLLLGLILLPFGYVAWTSRNDAAIGRLEALREDAKRDASHTSDAMRGLEVATPDLPPNDQKPSRKSTLLRGRCLVLDLNHGAGYDRRLPVSVYNSWLAEPWRARKPEDVSFVIWLEWHWTKRSSWIQYEVGSGNVTATSKDWEEGDREQCRVIMARPDGEILSDFVIAAEAVNGPVTDLRSYEGSAMQQIADEVNESLWAPAILKQFQSRRYER